jgi:hypothetical protein
MVSTVMVIHFLFLLFCLFFEDDESTLPNTQVLRKVEQKCLSSEDFRNEAFHEKGFV